MPKTCSKGYDSDIPITIEDIYSGSMNKCYMSNSDGVGPKSCPLDYETKDGYYGEDFSNSQKQNTFLGDRYGGLNSVETEEDVDVELRRKLKDADEKVVFLSEELEQETFLREAGYDISGLIQIIRNLSEEKISLALEVSGLLQCRIADRASAKEELSLLKAELDSRTRRLEKEKSELQSGLEKELDRRSSDWSFKLEKYQSEEQRLRERVRELAEQNVSLQREVSSLSEREIEGRSMMTYSEQQLKDLTARVEEAEDENQQVRKNLSELHEKYRASEEDRDCFRRNYEEKEKECKDLHKSITRLRRTCSEQEKTIDGLREALSDDITKKQSVENFDRHAGKLKMELLRLTGVEQALRGEVESSRHDVNSLRHENINLLNRLKVSAKEHGSFTFKLDQELWSRVCCLQNQGLSLLNDCTRVCSKLLEFIKEKAGNTPGSIKNVLDGQFVIESDMKIQGLKRETESLERSLRSMSALLEEKSNSIGLGSEAECTLDNGLGQVNISSEGFLRSELRAETLLTTLLREKLYSKELEVEQLQAEVATAVRGTDILRCEVQNAVDNLSCITHKSKDLELQMLKKDENMSRMQSELQESMKELTRIRGMFHKVSAESDLRWEQVNQYSEENMLLNSEVNMLKKKIEALDEDVLLKEGQITILKDTLGKKRFDILASPERTREFMLE